MRILHSFNSNLGFTVISWMDKANLVESVSSVCSLIHWTIILLCLHLCRKYQLLLSFLFEIKKQKQTVGCFNLLNKMTFIQNNLHDQKINKFSCIWRAMPWGVAWSLLSKIALVSGVIGQCIVLTRGPTLPLHAMPHITQPLFI